MHCPFGEAVGSSPHLTHCREWPECRCLNELLRTSIGITDDQTTEVARWWEQHYGGDQYFRRGQLNGFKDGKRDE